MDSPVESPLRWDEKGQASDCGSGGRSWHPTHRKERDEWGTRQRLGLRLPWKQAITTIPFRMFPIALMYQYNYTYIIAFTVFHCETFRRFAGHSAYFVSIFRLM
jgi:hypothetical protein